jgi:pimeloyl-ACP methyl ester carboxylesterase
MKYSIVGLGALVAFQVVLTLPATAQSPSDSIPYGSTTEAGAYITVEGARLYYETYGHGEPLLLIHGNGGNIAYMKPQIEYFARDYLVIVMDCRGRGRSELGPDSLTYVQMTKDIVAILDHLHLDSVCVVGRSDGGIISLLLAIHYPERIRKVAAFAANLTPDTSALYPVFYDDVVRKRKQADEMLARKDTSQDWRVVQQRNRLMEFQPHIAPETLRRITCPVLVLSTDRDIIPLEHTLLIYQNIARANLCIIPGETHYVTMENPGLFNATVAKFFKGPFKGEELRGQ